MLLLSKAKIKNENPKYNSFKLDKSAPLNRCHLCLLICTKSSPVSVLQAQKILLKVEDPWHS